ncbi:hypothetical protein [Streptomyces sp. NPDC089919]|uniref:hypothetical protein n=1 Tax=Streptomyces sp. NPDC089919 TaxID=3155188 RepID=UPI00342EBE0B
MPRRDLPPPPPSAQIQAWPDATALRADRAYALGELGRRAFGFGRLLLLWGVAALFALGWSFLGMALMSFEKGGTENILGLFSVALGAGVLVPGGFALAAGVRRERAERALLYAWARSGRDPVTDPGHRAPVRSLVWLLSSCAVSGLGLWLSFGAAPAGATDGERAYWAGLGTVLWLTGLTGVAKAWWHYRWALRAFAGPAARGGTTVPAGRAAPEGPRRAVVPAPPAGGPGAAVRPGATAGPGGRSASTEHRPPASG